MPQHRSEGRRPERAGRADPVAGAAWETEDTFRWFFESADFGQSLTLPGGETYVNPAFAGLLGYTREELAGGDWRQVTHPGDVALSEAAIAPLLDGERDAVRFTKRYLHRDGSVVWADVSTVVRRDEAGVPLYFATTVTDVTEARQAEEALRESEARYRALFTNMTAGFVLFEVVQDEAGVPVDLVILAANQGFEAAVGLKAAEAVGHRLTRVLPGIEKDAAGWIGTYGRVALSGEPRQFEMGSELLGRHYAVSAYQAGALRCGVTFTDTTERRRTELERQKFVMLADSSSEFIGMCDLDLTPVYVNPAGVRMVGLADGEAACRVKVQDYFFPEDQAFIADEFFPRVLREGHGDVEIRLRHFETGEPIWVYYYLFAVRDASGADVGWATVSHDITERRQAEAAIRALNAELEQRVAERTAALKAANEELEAFTYSVSHDLRAPLRAISGFSSLVLEEHAAMLDDDARAMLGRVVGNAALMGDIIDHLLAFSRLDRREVVWGRCDISAVVHEVFREVREQNPQRTLRLEAGDLPVCRADTALVTEVVRNLIGNAVKFTSTREEAVIEVGTSRDAGGGRTPDHDLETYFVRDNGVGFDPRYKDKLFQVFQRLHRADEFEGTGIGLALVKRIVEHHGGRVEADAELGRGATVSFSLPREEGKQAPGSPSSAGAPAAGETAARV